MSLSSWNEHTYYGRKINQSSATGVYLHMLEEHIQKILDKGSIMFKNDLARITKDFRKEIKDSLKEMRASIKDSERRNKVAAKLAEETKIKVEKSIKEVTVISQRVADFISKETMECTKIF